eukprot:15434124-Alexandrium_andersonii.AAC.1
MLHVAWVMKLTKPRAMRRTLLQSWAWSCPRSRGQALGRDAGGQSQGRRARGPGTGPGPWGWQCTVLRDGS